MDNLKYSALTHKVIGTAMEVQRHLGNGFQGAIYQRAVAIELRLQNMAFIRAQEMPVSYKGKSIGTRRVDFFIEGVITVELKAMIQLDDGHLAQALNYLEAYNPEVG